ncbi:MAG: aldo/keto reductase [Methanosphaera sp. rholeuAM74]|nr:MAG: aldo/keto reductase [Methanosphaera sp. rholeuAM74]
MKYNSIAGVRVSQIGFGAEWMESKTYDEVKEMVDCCCDNGVNLLDCWMSDPMVRSNLGKAIRDNRKYWRIQGHIGSTWQNNQYVRTRQMDKVKEAFSDLLERLNTDYIDFGMIHYVDEVTEYDEIINGEFMEYVYKLKDDETIHHIGLSTHNPVVAMKAAMNEDIELIMISANPAFDMMPPVVLDDYFDKDKYDDSLNKLQPIRNKLYQLCEDTDTSITVMKPFAGGRLLNENDSPFETALTPVQCIHYALTRPSSKSVLVGVENVDELGMALSYMDASNEDRDYNRILATAKKHSFMGSCTYCGHCSPCPSEINIAMVNKFYDLAVIHDTIPSSIAEHYENLAVHADSCIGCGECMTRCPFGVDIVDLMSRTRELFGY